jgi:hypothetical protein
MTQTALEERVAILERQMTQLLTQAEHDRPQKGWRSTVGMFTNDPVMKQIQEEGRKIRQADREQALRDSA